MTKFILNGSTLEKELEELRTSGLFKHRTAVTSRDRENFEIIEGEEEILQEIKEISEIIQF